ncbi:SIS domain-containing protein [Patescibacteria group bacterium]|nr:SIS domain-containing protein [Patescibacteria group bacterium]
MNVTNFTDDYINRLKKALDLLDRKKIEKAIGLIMKSYRLQRQIFIIGNGGSAATASHFACDLAKGTLSKRCHLGEGRFRVISLTDNVSLMTALANDLSYEDVFVQQLKNLACKNDLLILITGSGNSPNVIKALHFAKKIGMETIGFLGFKTGGLAAQTVDLPIVVESDHYGRIEDVHLILEHLITAIIKELKKEHHYQAKKRKKSHSS